MTCFNLYVCLCFFDKNMNGNQNDTREVFNSVIMQNVKDILREAIILSVESGLAIIQIHAVLSLMRKRSCLKASQV